MHEILDVYNEKKEVTGKTIRRGIDKLKDGEYRLIVDAIIVNDNNKILISKRSESKKHLPLLWECNGGSVRSGENSKEAIIREIKEELGLQLDFGFGKLLFTDIIKEDFKIRDVYVFYKNFDINDVKFTDNEACDAKYVDIDEFKKMYENGEMTDNSTYVINHWEEVLKGRI